MKKRVRDPEGKRIALLEAGLRLADDNGMANMSVNDVAAAAGVGKGSFYVHFIDRAAFLLELHRGFHDALVEDIETAIDGVKPGLDRLTALTTAFLDTAMRERTVRALLLDARAEPQIAEEIATRVSRIARLIEQDLRAEAWPDPAPAARLYLAMLTEASLTELARGRRDNTLRRSLLRYVTREGLPAPRKAR
ncbi:MAG TPA: TetR/AcrR family transcriptional regulator [Candidatus Angelobacter sp.]|jgi:TetR/AcrR family transcriptional repressor of nem operon|nr:TetR/AcrR family transcriptional regulator [Candidatus Angelobacter sp.]